MQSLAGFLLVRSFFSSLPNKQSCIEFVVESWIAYLCQQILDTDRQYHTIWPLVYVFDKSSTVHVQTTDKMGDGRQSAQPHADPIEVFKTHILQMSFYSAILAKPKPFLLLLP